MNVFNYDGTSASTFSTASTPEVSFSTSYISFYLMDAPWTLENWWADNVEYTLVPKRGDHLKGRLKPQKYVGVRPVKGFGRRITLNGRGMKIR